MRNRSSSPLTSLLKFMSSIGFVWRSRRCCARWQLLCSRALLRRSYASNSIKEEESKLKKPMTNVLSVVNSTFVAVVKSLYPEFAVSRALCKPSKDGSYKCTASLHIPQVLKASGRNMNPKEVAGEIIAHLPKPSNFEKCEIDGLGFVNVSLKPQYISSLLRDLLANGVRAPPIPRKLRVVVDFSSPNIAKEMHVGHLRSTIIGETLCRLLEFAGHNVLRINHIGDWGTQIGMLIAHLQNKYPDYSSTADQFTLSDLQSLYKESKVHFDEDPEFKKQAYSSVVKLQGNDPVAKKIWQDICEASRKEYQKIYSRLGVKIMDRGESFYQPLMPLVVKDLEEKGMVSVKEGRKLVFHPDQVPLTILKSDGGFTYDTSDLAALRQRIEEDKGDWLIYVVDSGQARHFQSVFAVGRRAGYASPETRIDHVGFGVVQGLQGKRLKTRSGETIRLVDLLDEGLERSLAKQKEKGRDKVLNKEELEAAQRAMAYGCIKYADLSHSRIHDYVFSFDKMLEDKGNTAVYLLYAYTRISSIARFANVSPEELEEAVLNTPIDLSHKKELKLAKCIICFPEAITQMMNNLFPHVLCNYVYELCTTFTEFYDNCYCVESDSKTLEIISVNMSRILLCEAAVRVLDKAFYILGLEPVSKM